VSVLFVDLVGFTSFAEDRDAESVRDLLSRYFRSATDVVERHGGTVEKFIGDAVMAVWGAPVAHEDDAERAVRTALELMGAVRALRPELQARAAVLTGEAAVTLGAQNQGMVAGDLVNTAARLQGLAEPGTVLVGEATMRAARGAIVFEAVGDRSLRGKSLPVPAWEAVRVVAARGGQGRTDALEAPFVGRDEELRQLKEVLHGVGRDRRPRLVSITGVAGIGKSRLVWELEKYVDGVAEDIYWHRGRSPSYGEGISFWALGEMVRRRAQLTEDADEETTRQRVTAMLQEYVADPAERARIEPAVLVLLGVGDPATGRDDSLFPAWRLLFERIAERGATVMVFEDVQWADSGSLDFIEHLLDWSRGLPILVITLARPELFDRRPGWGADRRSLTALALEPLPDPAMRQLLDGLVPGLPRPAADAIVGRAEGVPLYAVETVRSLLADGRLERRGDVYQPIGDLSTISTPETLRALIASRLDALVAEDRELLQDAAVLGQVFASDVLAAIAQQDAAAIEPRLRDLVRREMLDLERDPASPERGQYKFVQSLIREVAYGTLTRRDRRARHLAVARYYEGLADEEAAGMLASHYLAARDASEPGPEADALTGQARLALTGAADRAAKLGAHDQALAYLDRALAITTATTDRIGLLDRAAASAAIANRDAIGYAEEAITGYRSLGDQAGAISATTRLGTYLIEAGEVIRAVEVLEGVLPEAESSADEAALADVFANLSRVYMRRSANERSIATADQALAIAERLDLEDLVAESFNNKGSALSALGRRREAIVLLEAAVQLAALGSSRGREGRYRNNLAVSLREEDPRAAYRIIAEARVIAAQAGDRSMFSWLTAGAAIGAYSTGQGWDRSMAELRELLETGSMRSERLRNVGILAWFSMTRGEAVESDLERLAAVLGDSTEPEEVAHLGFMRGSAALLAGDPVGAFRLVWDSIVGPVLEIQDNLLLAGRCAIWSHDAQRLAMVAERLGAEPTMGSWGRAMRRHVSSALAALEGRVPEALDGLREARSRLVALGLAFEVATYAVDAAVLLPDDAEVRGWADEARAVFDAVGARPWLDRLDVALAAAVPRAVKGASVVPAAER
jgi:class 3 adenylate cyclase/tetratricopeptide (TPR) repeat protein